MLEPESFSESKYLFSPSPDGDSIIPALRLDVAFCTAAVVLPTGLTFYCITPPHFPITSAKQSLSDGHVWLWKSFGDLGIFLTNDGLGSLEILLVVALVRVVWVLFWCWHMEIWLLTWIWTLVVAWVCTWPVVFGCLRLFGYLVVDLCVWWWVYGGWWGKIVVKVWW